MLAYSKLRNLPRTPIVCAFETIVGALRRIKVSTREQIDPVTTPLA